MHRYLLHNGEIREAGEKCLAPGQIGLLSGWGVFSTLRVCDGVLFAWERHWERMKHDAERLRVPFPGSDEAVEAGLAKLIEANQAWNATLRVAVIRNRGGMWEGPGIANASDIVAFSSDLFQWPETLRLGLVPNARHAASEFAGTKYLSWAENLTRYERAHEQGFDEVILLNERGEVSECTSANLFIAEGDRIWTPPLSSGCLPGVTRAICLEAIRVPGVAIGERTIFPRDLEAADAVYVTSTTRALLPVREIEELRIRTGSKAGEALQKAFGNYLMAYVLPRRKIVSAK